MAERKLRLDAAVLDGVTAAGDGKASNATVETAQVLPHQICLAWWFKQTVYLPGGLGFEPQRCGGVF